MQCQPVYPILSDGPSREPEAVRQTRTISVHAAITIAALLALLANGPTLVDMLSLWRQSATYSHGWLVLPLAALLWWGRRDLVTAAEARGRGVALVLLLLLALGTAASQLLMIQTGAAVLWPLTLLATGVAAAGWRAGRWMLAPVVLLLCATPLAGPFTPLLQRISAVVSTGVCQLLGFPSARYGNHISIPGGLFEVSAGCSGMNFLLVAMVMAVFLGAWHRLALRPRLALLGAALGVALLANWVRIIWLVIVGHRNGMQHPLIAGEHYTLGWWLFAAALVALIVLFEWRLPRFERQVGRDAGREVQAGVQARPWTGLLLLLVPGLLLGARWTVPRPAGPLPAALPALAGCNGPGPADPIIKPRFLGPDIESFGEYRCTFGPVTVYSNQYLRQGTGRELLSSQNELLPAEWTRERIPTGVVGIEALAARAADGRAWRVVYHWHIAGRVAPGRRAMLAWQLFTALRRQPDQGGLALLAAPCNQDCDVITANLVKLSANWPHGR